MERTVLHVDCNKFYASVECLHRPELRDKPVAVGGSTESRHGIILTKNEIASRYGLVAGEPLWRGTDRPGNSPSGKGGTGHYRQRGGQL